MPEWSPQGHNFERQKSHPSSQAYVDIQFAQRFSLLEPDLEGLAETEVFIGEDQQCEDNSKANSSAAAVLINYNKDGFLHSLNSVEEDIEAEAAEEEISTKCYSLNHLGVTSLNMGSSSLSSSVVSSLHEPVIADKSSLSSCLQNDLNCLESYINYSNPNYTQGKQLTLKIDGQLLCPNGNTLRVIRPSSANNSITAASLMEEKCFSENSVRSTSPGVQYSASDTIKATLEKKVPIWHNPSKSDRFFGDLKCCKKDIAVGSCKRDGIIRSKIESRLYAKYDDTKYHSLPRRLKEKSKIDVMNENRKPRTALINKVTLQELPQESKNILDKYGTFPRKKTKESDEAKCSDCPRLKEKRSNLASHLAKIPLSNKVNYSSSVSPLQSCAVSNNALRAKASNTPNPLRLLSRHNSIGKERNGKYKSSSSCANANQSKAKIGKRNVAVQVMIKWDQTESSLEEKVRRLTEECDDLPENVMQAKMMEEEVQRMRIEAEKLKEEARLEKMEKEELQEELDMASGKVKEMLTSMDGVEREFNNREETLIELENQLQKSGQINIKMHDKISQYEEFTVNLKKDLDRSLAAQKILLQQVQDLEVEGREMVEFMAEEKNALSECLKEAENEIRQQRRGIEELNMKLDMKTKECLELSSAIRGKSINGHTPEERTNASTEEIMLYEGADISGASVSLTKICLTLHILTDRLISDHSILENDIENVLVNFDLSGIPPIQPKPFHRKGAIPQKPGSFLKSFVNALKISQDSVKLLAIRSKMNNEFCDVGTSSSHLRDSQSFLDQVANVDKLLARFLKVCSVLKSDADAILLALENENECVCSQLEVQMQTMEADLDSLRSYEVAVKREFGFIRKQFDIINDSLVYITSEDISNKICNVKEQLFGIKLSFLRAEKLLLDNLQERLTALEGVGKQVSHNCVSEGSPLSDNEIYTSAHSPNDFMRAANESGLGDGPAKVEVVVNHVLETLETVSDVVSACPALKNLYLELNSRNSFQDTVGCHFANRTSAWRGSTSPSSLSETSPGIKTLSLDGTSSHAYDSTPISGVPAKFETANNQSVINEREGLRTRAPKMVEEVPLCLTAVAEFKFPPECEEVSPLSTGRFSENSPAILINGANTPCDGSRYNSYYDCQTEGDDGLQTTESSAGLPFQDCQNCHFPSHVDHSMAQDSLDNIPSVFIYHPIVPSDPESSDTFQPLLVHETSL